MLYDLSLHMGYAYDTPATGARHMIRVMPMTLPGRQRLVAGSLQVSPAPDEQTTFMDFFNHAVASVFLRAPHETLDIRMQARVQVEGQSMTADFSPLLKSLPVEINNYWSLEANSPHHFLGASPRIPEDAAIAAYASEVAAPRMTILQIATALCKRIHDDFVYDGEATEVDTTPQQAFELRRGVCQDFTHIMISGLRSLGVPAGYVSGFLRTIPPPGKERLGGADAMHAWVRVWCGDVTGWIELDPTNDMPAGVDHIVVAHGRDYSDVAPVIGVVKSYGSQALEQAVDVIPV
ncbi:transglutaminase family protein [Rhizobiaceae bacterium n13]|uniref:Transglutaminase family protein n=1 Tax=Ferirhizobium litorale TaxID=2927786 RepID=A0AAE3QB73_9HYPH|nr:transglutaminase family protein [Fererhizobium litorale]MDI7860490.1 transglutaminase family protein [Fererhizobium litorale]MDI7920625.1 transglutaminase family protein [Fererhizobium litorale]